MNNMPRAVSQRKKVMQTATVQVEIVVDQEGLSSVIAGLTGIAAVYNNKGQFPYVVAIASPKKWHGYRLVFTEVSYTAMGANRNDISRKIEETIEADLIRVSKSVITGKGQQYATTG